MRGLAAFALGWVLAGCASTPPVTLAPSLPSQPVEVRALAGAQWVSRADRPLELGIFLPPSPELEPLGLEGTSGLLVELATERAGLRHTLAPHARALALGAQLEPYRSGAWLGWRLRLAPCEDCPETRLDEAWELLLDIALQPDLRAGGVTRRAEQYRDRLAARVDATRRAAWRWAVALAAGHGRPVGIEPTDRAASGVDREALARLHRTWVTPERLVLMGPHRAAAEARLRAWAETRGVYEAPRVSCAAPPQRGFRLTSGGPARWVEARLAPGWAMPGRRGLEAALTAARTVETLRSRPVALVDLGSEAVLLDEGGPEPLETWLAQAQAAAARLGVPAAPSPVTWVEEALAGASEGELSLGPPLTVWWGDPSQLPGLPVELPRDQPRCHP